MRSSHNSYTHVHVSATNPLRFIRYTGAMWAVVRRMFTFTLFAVVVAYAVFLMAGATIYAQEEQRSKTVWVRDEISPNIHRLAGMIMLPSSCHELSVKTEKLSSDAFKLVFTTWEHPYIECADGVTPVAFHEVVFAPAVGVTFIATLDGRPLPIVVSPEIAD